MSDTPHQIKKIVSEQLLCPDQAVATSCAVPIQMGDPPVLMLWPQVVGPQAVPVMTDPTLARRQPELAVLSAMAHGERSGQQGVFDALLAASRLSIMIMRTCMLTSYSRRCRRRSGTPWRLS